MRTTSLRQFTLLMTFCGMLAVSAQYACTDSSCNSSYRGGNYQTMEEITSHQIETLDQALVRQGRRLTADQSDILARQGHLFGVVSLDRPIKHPDGEIEMPSGWLPALAAGHPWAKPLTPADDAFYSWFESFVVEARLYDPASPLHQSWAKAYLGKVHAPENNTFREWTYASSTECAK